MSAQDLMTAIKAQQAERVRELVLADPLLADTRESSGLSALMLTLYYGLFDAAQALIDARESIDVFEAAALGQTEILRRLIEEDPSLLYAKAGDGFSALHLACFFGQLETARALVEESADVNGVASNPTEVCPLHSAVAHGASEIVQLLLENGAQADVKQRGGYTPLMGAAAAGLTGIVQQLLASGVDPQVCSDEGQTARDLAQDKNQQAVLDLLP